MKNFLLDGTISDLEGIAEAVKNILNNIVGPVLIVIGAAAAIYAIYLGVMYAKAEDANKRKEVQGRLIGAAIGVVIIVVGIILCYAIDWSGLISSNQGLADKPAAVVKAFLSMVR
ncbi:MAG: Mbov_0395 family pilin-like conjugal transfer protein [Christensenellales bacterium]